MADVSQIPNLPAVVSLDGSELFEGVQAGSSVKITLDQIIAASRAGTPLTLPVPVSVGGTGLDTFTVGDIMYASATQEFSKLSDVATGNAIISGGVGAAPSYGKIGLTTHVDGILPVANGGTNQSAALTQSGMIYANTTSSMASTAAGTATQVLHGGTTPSFSAVSLTADVSGVLPETSGGTNQSSYATGDILYASATNTLGKLADVATGNALISGGVGAAPSYGKIGLNTHVSGVLPIANGGTNLTTYTTGDLLYASATNVLGSLPDVATGNALLSGGIGAAPAYGKVGLTTHVSGTLPVGNGGTGQTSALTQYGLIYGDTTTAMASLASLGTTTQVLHGNASGAPTWGAINLATDVSGTLALANGGTSATSAPAAAANLMGYTATPTAAGTTTLDNTSSQYQLFTGTLTQTVKLPDTSTLTTGWTFHIVNNSTGDLTIRASSVSGSFIQVLYPQMTMMVTCISTAVTNSAAWEFGYTDFASVTGTGGAVLATSPTITTPTLSGNVGAGGANYGTSGQVLTSGGTGASTSWTDQLPSRSSFAFSGTWTKPAGARLVLVRVWGGGGSGAGGAVGAAGVQKYGGGGGGGGAYFEKYFFPNVLSATVTVTVPSVVAGGASGVAGTAGGTTSFGAYITCAGGAAGQLAAGTNTGGGAQAAGTAASSLTVPALTGGTNTAAYYGGAAGGQATVSAGFNSQFGGGGGGAGGSETAANALQAPTAGGQSNYNAGGAAGTSSAGAPTAGGFGGSGCGGGGGGSAQTANGANGGDGLFPGGGGGGGGSTRTGFLGGTGGYGNSGYVEVYTW